MRIGKEIIVESGGRRAASRLVGWKLKSFRGLFMVEPPLTKNGFLTPVPGQEAVLKFESGGTTFALNSVFVEPLRKTGLMLFVTEDEAAIGSLIATGRFMCMIPATLTDPATGHPVGEGMVFNMGLGGIGFYADGRVDLPTDNIVGASFHVCGLGRVEQQKVKVNTIKTGVKRYEYSGPFLNLEKKHEDVLRAYLDFCGQWAAA